MAPLGAAGPVILPRVGRPTRCGAFYAPDSIDIGPATSGRVGDGIWRSGIGVPAKSRRHGREIHRAQRTDFERRALSDEMPVFAYI